MTIADAGGEVLVRDVKVVLGEDLLAAHRYDERLPKGRFDVVDTSGEGREAGADDLGTRVQVKYRSVAELAA